MTRKEFEKKWFLKIENELLKDFPDDFIVKEDCEFFVMAGKTLIIGPELFWNYEILDVNGNKHYQTDSLSKAKYILYANRLKPDKILIPRNENQIINAVRSYEKHLDNILKDMQQDFYNTFNDPNKFLSTSKSIFNSLILRRY